MADNPETQPARRVFDFDAYPLDTLFHDRRTGPPGNEPAETKPAARAPRKERRRRVDPTTFEKQYRPDELEFMTAMQDFKSRTGKPFPTYGEVLKIAQMLGYHKDPEGTEIVPSGRMD